MKKSHYLVLATLIAMVAAVVFINPMKAVSQKNNSQQAYSIPDDVSQILKHSCASCHNSGGNGMAESMWSLSAWDQYAAKKQAKKATAICKAITKGSMPPSSAGSDKIPTKDQKAIICKWASSLQVKK